MLDAFPNRESAKGSAPKKKRIAESVSKKEQEKEMHKCKRARKKRIAHV
jgi:hypothetical protein